MSDLIEAKVLVPSSRLAELYVTTAGWLRGTDPPTGARDAEGGGWTETDAVALVRAINENGRTILRVLATAEGRPVRGSDLRAAVGMERRDHALPGLLGAIGRACRGRGHDLPWEWDEPTFTYTMAHSVGRVFVGALGQL